MYQYNVTIVRVVDGDTARVDIDLGFGVTYANQNVRFFGIDTEESRTRDLTEKWYGKLAAQYVKDRLIVGQRYKMSTTIDKGKYGRILGTFYVIDAENWNEEYNLNERMVTENYAVAYFGQSKDDIQEGHMANRQRLAQRGLHPDNESYGS